MDSKPVTPNPNCPLCQCCRQAPCIRPGVGPCNLPAQRPSNPQRNIVGELLTQNCDDDSLEVAAAREIERLRRVADAQAVAIEVLEAKFHNLRERLRDVMNSAADVAAPVASNPLHGAYVLIYQARLGLNHKGVVDGVEKWTASADAWMARYEGATADVANVCRCGRCVRAATGDA